MITQERLKEVLRYDPDTGIFMWIVTLNSRAPAGSVAGSTDKKGYIHIMIDGRFYKAHRLAILYTDGYLPENTVDHKDRVPWHNWRDNLREASYQCQARNCGMLKNNTSGVKGVCWDKRGSRWLAYIKVDYRRKHLGYYDTLLEAAYVRYAAEQCLGFQDCDTNSSALVFIRANTNKERENG